MEPIDRIIAQEERDQLKRAIRLLPEQERMVLRMHHIEGFSAENIADCLMLPASAVRRLLARGMLALRNLLARDHCNTCG